MLAFGMPAAFTRDQIAAIAALAQLELDAAEIDLFARQLGDILAYAEQVQQIDTTGVPPTAIACSRGAARRSARRGRDRRSIATRRWPARPTPRSTPVSSESHGCIG